MTLQKIRRTEEFSYTDYGEKGDFSMTNIQIDNSKNPMDEITDIFEPKNSKVYKRVQFDKLEEDEENEIEQRELKISELKSDLIDLTAIAKGLEGRRGGVDEKLKIKIRYIERTLDTLKEGTMTEHKFLKSEVIIDEDDFQYNRPIHKGGLYEETLELPYQRYMLFRKTKNTQKLSAYKVGEPNGAVLKASINIKVMDKEQETFPDIERLD